MSIEPTIFYRLNFTAVRSPGQAVQLQELRLYADDELIDLREALVTNPGGSSPPQVL